MVDDRGYRIMTAAPGNHLTQVGDTRYEYDGYGNRILEVTGEEEQRYEWDTEHRLTAYRCRVRGSGDRALSLSVRCPGAPYSEGGFTYQPRPLLMLCGRETNPGVYH